MDPNEAARRKIEEIERARRQAQQDDIEARLRGEHEARERQARADAQRLQRQIMDRARNQGRP